MNFYIDEWENPYLGDVDYGYGHFYDYSDFYDDNSFGDDPICYSENSEDEYDYYTSDDDSDAEIDAQETEYWKSKREKLKKFIDEEAGSLRAKGFARRKLSERRPQSIGDLVMCRLNEDRCSDAKYCDVTIKTNARRFPVHRCVLSAVSDYFSKMFSLEMKEKYEREVELKEISSDVMAKLLDMIYSNDDDPIITDEDISEFLPIARYMQIGFLIRSCGKSFVKNLTVDSALSKWIFAKAHDFKIRQTEKFISTNVGSVSEKPDFLQLDEEELECILKLDCNSMEKYKALIKWTKEAVDERKKHLNTLLKHINFRDISETFLFSSVCQEPLIMSSQEGFELTAKAMSNRGESMSWLIGRGNGLSNSFSKSVVFLYIRQNSLRAKKYEVETKNWTDLPSLDNVGEDFGVAYCQKKVFVIGGKAKFGSKSSKSVFSLNMWSETPAQWIEMPSLNLARRSMGCASLSNRILVVGGFATKNCLQHTETFTPIMDPNWRSYGKSIKTSRRNLALVPCGKHLYAIGGCRAEHGRPCGRNERLDGCDQWEEKSPMIEERGGGFAGVALNGKIYVMGSDNIQWNIKSFGASAECYDPENDSWRKIARLKSLQFVNSACVVDGKLVAYGFSVRRKVALLEVYDPFKDEWEVLQQFDDEMKNAKMLAV